MTPNTLVRLRTRGMVAALTLSGALLIPVVLQAQDQKTAFVHGYNSGGGGWQGAAGALRNQFQIDTLLPDLGWKRRLSEQRGGLDGYLASQPLMPGVGHSNGGLITRSYVQESGNNRVDRILAVNSGHRGAPLAQNILNYRVKGWIVSLIDAVAAPLAELIPNPVISRGVRVAVNIGSVVWVQTSDPLNAPVLNDMTPSSAFIQRLEAQQGTEAARAYSRVGIGTSASPSGIFCHALIGGGSWETCRKAIRASQVIYVGTGTFLNWTGRPGLGHKFLNGAARLKRVDPDWLRYVGAGGTYNGYSGSPDATDGILPLGTQQYPGNTFQQNLTYPTYNISHQEANDPINEMLREFRNVFANHFGIAQRSTSGGGEDPPPCEPVPPQLQCAV